jgi:hypothetical protein
MAARRYQMEQQHSSRRSRSSDLQQEDLRGVAQSPWHRGVLQLWRSSRARRTHLQTYSVECRAALSVPKQPCELVIC